MKNIVRILSSAFLVSLILGSIVYAAPGFKLTNIAGMNFFKFFQDNSLPVWIDADSFHSRGNNSYISSPADTFNYILGKTFLGTGTTVVMANGNVGIGTATPGATLEVAWQVKITGGAPWAGKVLTSDAAGLATWTTAAGWGITGGQTNYIARFLSATSVGTGTLYDDGTNVGIGTSYPWAKLEVAGDAKLNGLTVGRWWGNVVSNTANGLWALSGNTSGGFNTAIWNSALLTNTTGDYNTANGFGALSSNTTGYNNVANGYFALSSNTTGYSNTAIWTSALYANTWGTANTAVWNGSLSANTADYNTAIWNNSLLANTTGVGNTANGAGSLRFNTTGNYNTANGFTALINSTTGFNNTANGYFALYSNTTGYYNTAIWANTLTNNTTGTGNTAIWNNVLTANTTGSNNSALGNYANITLGSLSNVTLIGANTVGSQSNTVILGSWANVGIGTSTPWAKLEVNGAVNVTGNITALAYFYSSDRRLKENIVPLNNSLAKILSLNGYLFDWKKDGRKDIGVIAQEVEKQFPDIVHTDEKTGLKSVEYGNLVAPIIEAIKELSLKWENTMKSIADQQKIIDAQNEKIQSLESRLERLEFAH